MTINVGRYAFEGPYTNTDLLRDQSGIYCILDAVGGQYTVIDIGESAQVRTRVANHDRKSCWSRNARGVLMVAVLYAPALNRVFIEQELRRLYNPVCGIR